MIFLLFVGDPAVPSLHQPALHLNYDQPAQPFGKRIASCCGFAVDLSLQLFRCVITKIVL
ncbi:MAG: hypothetical protein LBT09_03070 [Planctomycetaceae bacterium]|nr:hypothetical protein [Planctomycetaceae bacterium]